MSGSLPSRRIISGKMRLLAFMNQLHTCRTLKLAACDNINFSWSDGYALYLCSASQVFNILTDSFGRLPRLLRALAEVMIVVAVVVVVVVNVNVIAIVVGVCLFLLDVSS